MATLAAISHNPGARSSGKQGRFPHLNLAAEVARHLRLVPTWANLQTIRLAIIGEAEYSEAPHAEVAVMLIGAGREWTPRVSTRPLASWEARFLDRLNFVDRFWFEDARWRDKLAYQEFRKRLEERPRC